jgi:hypothetical protein
MTQTSGASSSVERPLFRYDLETKAIEEGGNRYVDVQDPKGGKSFRFYEVEYAVACGMDGERDLAGLVRWAMLELDLQTTKEEVGAVVAKLAELNYIDGVAGAAAGDEAPVAAKKEPPTPKPADTAPPKVAAAAGGMDMELGDSGKSPIGGPRPVMPAEADDLELGLAGKSTAAAAAQAQKSSIESEFELGVAGNEGVGPVDEVPVAQTPPPPESIATAAEEVAGPSKSVSTDLSATFRVDKDEVKEAVRASKVMSAAEVPPELAAEMAEASAAVAEDATPEPIAEVADISASIAEDAAEQEVAGDAIALKEDPKKVAKREAAAKKEAELAKKRANRKPLVRRSASLVLWLILLGAVAGGAYYYYTEFVQEPPAAERPAPPVIRTQQPAPPPEPPVVEAPSSVMALTEAPTEEALSPRAGVIAWVVDPGSEVSEGDAILKIKGFERFQREVDKEKKSLETYQLKLETAQARNSTSKIPGLEGNVARKEGDVAKANAKLDAYLVKAPIDGVVEVLVSKGKLKANQAIGKVTGTPSASAVFELPEGVSASLDDELEVVAADDPELTATCTVTETEGQSVTLSCPTDSGIEADAAIQLVLD